MKKYLKTLCSNLKLLRTSRELSQENVATSIKLARSTYSTYESGAKSIDMQTIDSLAAFYNVSFDSLANHDLSKGIFNKIYFDDSKKSLIPLLNSYQSLSVISRNLINERLNVLLEREGIFYEEYCRREDEIKKMKKARDPDKPQAVK